MRCLGLEDEGDDIDSSLELLRTYDNRIDLDTSLEFVKQKIKRECYMQQWRLVLFFDPFLDIDCVTCFS